MAEQSQGFYTPEGVNGYGEEEEEDEEEGEGFVQEGEEEEDDDEEFEGEGLGEEEDEDEDDGIGDGEGVMDIDPHFDPTALGLKEIGNLASWTVSSCKPGCGVEALRDENTDLFWQSDGPQPHHINIHFSRFVAIRAIRLFLNFDDDESYTPTRIVFLAGTGYHDLITFDELSFSQPKGWIDARLGKVGGGEDGKTLRAFLVQIKIVENHQNGKDTHVRGLKIYAKDERAGDVGGLEMLGDRELVIRSAADAGRKSERKHVEEPGLTVPDWMGEPELR
ncbi:anaphase-promoting complex, subunit 10-domain-containing protein [Xylogone sp. PMI_703]|nr:anaphase-promoting complex, subunit 10-domain-containing protein [Xylogone sp. PMI_703]